MSVARSGLSSFASVFGSGRQDDPATMRPAFATDLLLAIRPGREAWRRMPVLTEWFGPPSSPAWPSNCARPSGARCIRSCMRRRLCSRPFFLRLNWYRTVRLDLHPFVALAGLSGGSEPL